MTRLRWRHCCLQCCWGYHPHLPPAIFFFDPEWRWSSWSWMPHHERGWRAWQPSWTQDLVEGCWEHLAQIWSKWWEEIMTLSRNGKKQRQRQRTGQRECDIYVRASVFMKRTWPTVWLHWSDGLRNFQCHLEGFVSLRIFAYRREHQDNIIR